MVTLVEPPLLRPVHKQPTMRQALDAVEGDVSNLKAACARISGALRESKASTSEMLAEVDRYEHMH